MIAIVDYGVGNLFSLLSSLRALDLEAEVTGDAGRSGRQTGSSCPAWAPLGTPAPSWMPPAWCR